MMVFQCKVLDFAALYWRQTRLNIRLASVVRVVSILMGFLGLYFVLSFILSRATMACLLAKPENISREYVQYSLGVDLYTEIE
jgi:hypothetical protein